MILWNPVKQDGREPRTHARGPAREGAAGMRVGGEGGGRDADWQRGCKQSAQPRSFTALKPPVSGRMNCIEGRRSGPFRQFKN